MSRTTRLPRGSRPAKRPRLSRPVAISLLSLLLIAAASVVAFGDVITKNPIAAGLVAVGPTEEPDGFPSWYKDSSAAGVRVEPCLDTGNALCNILPDTMPHPDQPVSFPDNFPDEFFYAVADNTMTPATGVKLVTRVALEGAFASATPQPGQQIVFGRVRFFFSGLKAGETYTITHPYGVDRIVADQSAGEAPGVGEIRFTEDTGVNPGGFGDALKSRIGPFLSWTADPTLAAGYLGNPAVDHAIKGSPYGTNFVRVEGPGISPSAAASGCPTASVDCLQGNLFSVSGKIATNGGVGVDRVTYSRSATSPSTGGTLNVFANSDAAPQTLEVSDPSATTHFDPTQLKGGLGHFDGVIAYTGADPPSTVKVANTSDVPDSVKADVPVTDQVTGSATFNADTGQLRVAASSSDALAKPALTVKGYGNVDAATGAFTTTLPGTPADVTITSAKGGSVTLPVSLTGASFAPIPVVAIAGPNQKIVKGLTVTLDGSASTGPVKTYAWARVACGAGTAANPITDYPGTIVLSNNDQAKATFVAPDPAPNTSVSACFRLTVTGSGGPKTDRVRVDIFDSAADPVADAGLDQKVAQGATVTLTGAKSVNTTGYSWKQLTGTAVTLSDPTVAKPTFVFPKKNEVLTFELTAKNAGAVTSTDTVSISTDPDRLTTSLVQYTRSKTQWDLKGTSTVFGPGVTIIVHSGSTIAGPEITRTTVDTLGAWTIRLSPSTAPLLPTSNAPKVSIESSAGGTLENLAVTVK
jgi:methionine-rich copper-binding protein CopC